MARIKDIEVKVTYTVGLGNIKAPQEIINQLKEIAENTSNQVSKLLNLKNTAPIKSSNNN